MAVVWLILEFVILFFYYDLPVINSVSDDEKSEDQNGYDYTVNGSVEENSFDKKALYGNNTSINETRVGRSSDYIISSDTSIGDLVSSIPVIDSEKQKLINASTSDFHKRSRTPSVMDKWHLAKGTLANYISYIVH